MTESKDARLYLCSAAAALLLVGGIEHLINDRKSLHPKLPCTLGCALVGSGMMMTQRLPYASLAGAVSAGAAAATSDLSPQRRDVLGLTALLCGYAFASKRVPGIGLGLF